ncbi:MAG: hypothetical protein ACKO96_31970, partial [Flammeovirgaceae bacterium]
MMTPRYSFQQELKALHQKSPAFHIAEMNVAEVRDEASLLGWLTSQLQLLKPISVSEAENWFSIAVIKSKEEWPSSREHLMRQDDKLRVYIHLCDDATTFLFYCPDFLGDSDSVILLMNNIRS